MKQVTKVLCLFKNNCLLVKFFAKAIAIGYLFLFTNNKSYRFRRLCAYAFCFVAFDC